MTPARQHTRAPKRDDGLCKICQDSLKEHDKFVEDRAARTATLAENKRVQKGIADLEKEVCRIGDAIHAIQHSGNISAMVINDLDGVIEIYHEVRRQIRSLLQQAGEQG